MGKQPGKWTPPEDAVLMQVTPDTEWTPPEDAIPVKKKDDTSVRASSGNGWTPPQADFFSKDSQEQAGLSGENSGEERSPLISFGKKVYSTLVNQVAPNTSLAIQALLNQSLETVDFAASKVPGMKSVNKFLNENVGEIPTLTKLHEDFLLKDAIGFANERSKADQEFTKGMINSYTQIHDITSAANWATGALAQTAAQIIPALLTRGASAAGQEIGSIYLDSVNRIAEQNGITPTEVIDKNLDEKAIAIAAGFGAGALDMIGAKGVAGAFSKSPAGIAFKSKMRQFINSAPIKESWTEMLQTGIEHAGASATTKEGIEKNIKYIQEDLGKPETIQDIKESGAQGLVGASGISAIGHLRTAAQTIEQEKVKVGSTSDIEAADKAAEVIQQRVDNPVVIPEEKVTPEPVQKEEPTTVEPFKNFDEWSTATHGLTRQEVLALPEDQKKKIATEWGGYILSQKTATKPPVAETPTEEESPSNYKTLLTEFDKGEMSVDDLVAEVEGLENASPELEAAAKKFRDQMDESQTKWGARDDQDAYRDEFELAFRNEGKQDVTPKKESKPEWISQLDKDLTKKLQPHEEVAQEYHKEARNPTMSPAEKSIADTLTKKGLALSSVEKGMEHELSPDMRKNYFGKGSQTTLDQAAQQASLLLNPKGNGTEVSPEDVWQFLKKFPHGRASMHTPKGNPKLLELSNKYQELTGKTINRKIAEDIAESVKDSVGDADVNTNLQGLLDEKGDVDDAKVLSEINKDPAAFASKFGLSEDELRQTIADLHERQHAESQRTNSAGNQQTGGQERQGGALSEEFRDKTKDPGKQAEEINSKTLTRAEGLGMGKGLAAGTYVSTEKQNRYSKTAQRVKVTIKKPFVFLNENLIIPFRNKILNDNFDKFGEEDFEGDPFSDKKTIEGLTFKGIEKLADLVKEKLQSEGFDSIYLPESETQEGELIVFDKANVQTVEKGPYQQEAEKRVEQAEKEYAAAQNAYDDKKAQIAKSLKEDQIDIFGNRKGDKGKLFQEGAADRSEAKKQLAEAEAKIEKAREKLSDAHLEVDRAIELDGNSLFKKEAPTAPRKKTATKGAMELVIPKEVRNVPVKVIDINAETGVEQEIEEESQDVVTRTKRRVKALDLLINCVNL